MAKLCLLEKIIKIALLVFFLIWIIALTQKDQLPGKSQILSPLFEEPIQTKTQTKPFSLVTADGEAFDVRPVFDYELKGLIVSYHHSSSWMDLAHRRWKDYLNLKDICLIYGENISSEIYKRMKFSNRDWSCWTSFSGSNEEQWEQSRQFNEHYLSNNHILAKDPILIKKILSAEKGDQIYFKGHLVNYAKRRNSLEPQYFRNSSVTRNDQGNGACEVIYVTDFKILKKANVLWRASHIFSGWMIFILIVSFFAVNFYEDIQFSRGRSTS